MDQQCAQILVRFMNTVYEWGYKKLRINNCQDIEM